MNRNVKKKRGGNILKKKEKKRELHRVLSTSTCAKMDMYHYKKLAYSFSVYIILPENTH
jgi:hypothetical protein